jgi:hypothetical protein
MNPQSYKNKSVLPSQHVHILTTDFLPYSAMLQEGVGFLIKSESTLKKFLIHTLGLSSHYIENRIKTAFINQRPVDNYETAIIQDQDTLGLSGAMPGLVGATLRKNSVLSSFRNRISFTNLTDKEDGFHKTNGTIQLKVFNLLIKEIGPIILEKGVLIQSDSLKSLFETERSKQNTKIQSVIIDGQEHNINTDTVISNIKTKKNMLLVVKAVS